MCMVLGFLVHVMRAEGVKIAERVIRSNISQFLLKSVSYIVLSICFHLHKVH